MKLNRLNQYRHLLLYTFLNDVRHFLAAIDTH
jgi:hypothetical protein